MCVTTEHLLDANRCVMRHADLGMHLPTANHLLYVDTLGPDLVTLRELEKRAANTLIWLRTIERSGMRSWLLSPEPLLHISQSEAVSSAESLSRCAINSVARVRAGASSYVTDESVSQSCHDLMPVLHAFSYISFF
jgi:hypothetical protein